MSLQEPLAAWNISRDQSGEQIRGMHLQTGPARGIAADTIGLEDENAAQKFFDGDDRGGGDGRRHRGNLLGSVASRSARADTPDPW